MIVLALLASEYYYPELIRSTYLNRENYFDDIASSNGTKNEKGIVLSLNLCKEFTEIQEGKIGFKSVPGPRSVFFISMSIN